MNQFELPAEFRETQGKSASRRLRRSGKVPAIVYGAGKAPVAIELLHNDVMRRSEVEAFYSHILTLKFAGSAEQRVVLKDLQRHPVRPQILHLDFQRVDEDQALTMRVPLHFINEIRCVGVKQGGGIVSHLLTELEVTCLPRDLPAYIEVDIERMDLGDTLHLSDLVLPAGVKIAALLHGGDASRPVVSVHLPRIATEGEAEQPAAEGAAGAGEAGAPAPDAGGAS